MKTNNKFGGHWKLYESEVVIQGELHVDYDNHVILLELIMPASNEKPMPRAPYKGKIPYVNGRLFDGKQVLLYDCTTGQESNYSLSYTRQVIYAKYAFWGLEINSREEIKFKQVQFDFGNIIEWSQLCKYKWEYASDKKTSLVWSEKEPVTLQLRDNLNIVFWPTYVDRVWGSFDDEFTVKQKVLIDFQYEYPVTWETVLDDAMCIQYLVGLALNRKVEIHNSRYQHILNYYEFTDRDGVVNKIDEYGDVTLGIGKIRKFTNEYVAEYPFRLEDLKNGNVLVNWMKNYPKLKPILDLYFTSFSTAYGSPEMLFLNLMQALETFHSRFITNNFNDYKKRVERIVDSFCHDSRCKEVRTSFLLNEHQLKNTSSIILRSRLADLIFAEGVQPFHPRIYSIEDYLKKLVHSRNYYTHYDESKLIKSFSNTELPWINNQLITLLGYHILVLIGIDAHEVKKTTVRKNNEISDWYSIQEGTHEIRERNSN